MELNIKCFAGNTHKIIVNSNCTVYNLKKLIEKEEGISPEQQKLVFMGKILNDNNALLTDLNIKNTYCIHLAIALRGG